MQPQPLDLLRFPLDGVRLIEASAGTGKTYAIARLYLRLLLEKGLDVRALLVVTFTRAATAELRGRIREVIQEALHGLESGEPGDEFIAKLLTDCADPELARSRLRAALLNLDEAAVYTINGFCQRVLQEHALESGAPFEATFIENEDELVRATVEDFWRRTFYPAEAAGLARLVVCPYEEPAALQKTITDYLARDLEILPVIAPETVDSAAYRRARETVTNLWRAEADAIKSLLDTSPVLSRAQDHYRQDRLALAYAGLDAFAATESCDYALPEPNFELFLPATLDRAVSEAKRKKGAKPPAHPFFLACQALQTLCDDRLKLLIQDALRSCRADLRARKQAQRTLAFDDLIASLNEALAGESGALLAATLRRRYPVAMIDEFQDTDPAQYAIFRRIYADAQEGGLFMIGDPKQAIYGFRGGDIYTYLKARSDTRAAAAHYTLDTNWRSAKSLVDAVNHLFGKCRSPFLYPGEIDFHPVKAAGRADGRPLTLDGVTPPPLCLWYVPKTEENAAYGKLDKPIARDKAMDAIARAVAGEIVRLLWGKDGHAACAEAPPREPTYARLGDRSLEAGDIAVLVRDRFEAEIMRDALRRSGLASVFLSQDSVFATPEAAELQTLLAAVAEPLDGRLVRTALAGALTGLSAEDLARLARDEAAWERLRLDFLRYHARMSRHGFMAMFYEFLSDFGVAGRLLASADGERRLTDLLHLAELLQAESTHSTGPEGLVRWLAAQRRQPNGRAEGQQLRLESDENLVQIVTIHKSKGLEYPVVFLPTVWGAKPHKGEPPFVFHRAADRAACLELGSEALATHRLQVDRERLAEELRLLYVALTRAQHRCYLIYGDIGEARRGALSYLLYQNDAMADPVEEVPELCASLDEATRRARLVALAEASGGAIHLADLPEERPDPGVAPVALGFVPPSCAVRVFGGRIDTSWRVASYSALTARGRSEAPVDFDAEPAAPATEEPERYGRFGFPRGERAGRLLHEWLERVDFAGAAPELSEEAGRVLRKYGYDEILWQNPLTEWMVEVLNTPLDGRGLRLRDIPTARRLNELEFHYPLAGLLHPGRLEASLQGLAGYRADSPKLRFDPTRGVMHGFIDLVFEHGGRYYLADYKSNHLGSTPSAYYPAPHLTDAMNAHRYDLQYLLYTLALHRYLRWRLGERYDYAHHFGGVYYLFLRGMSPNHPQAGVYFTRPEIDVIDRLDRMIAGQ